jgi:hypothetical protein
MGGKQGEEGRGNPIMKRAREWTEYFISYKLISIPSAAALTFG